MPKKSAIDEFKTTSKRAVQKTAQLFIHCIEQMKLGYYLTSMIKILSTCEERKKVLHCKIIVSTIHGKI